MSPVPFASKSGDHVPQLLWERRPWVLLFGVCHMKFPTPMPWLRVKYNYFSLRRRPSEIILFQRTKTRLKLFQRLINATRE